MADVEIKTDLTQEVGERSTPKLEFTVKTEDGVRLGVADLQSFRGTLYDIGSGQVLNSFSNVNLLADSRVSVDADKLWTLIFQIEDNPIIDDTKTKELHCLALRYTWLDSGVLMGATHEIFFYVRNARVVPGT